MYVLRLKYSSNYAITTDSQSVTPSVLESNLSASENKDKICIIHRKIIILQT